MFIQFYHALVRWPYWPWYILTSEYFGNIWVLQCQCFFKTKEVDVVCWVDRRRNAENMMRHRNASSQARIVFYVIYSACEKSESHISNKKHTVRCQFIIIGYRICYKAILMIKYHRVRPKVRFCAILHTKRLKKHVWNQNVWKILDTRFQLINVIKPLVLKKIFARNAYFFYQIQQPLVNRNPSGPVILVPVNRGFWLTVVNLYKYTIMGFRNRFR